MKTMPAPQWLEDDEEVLVDVSATFERDRTTSVGRLYVTDRRVVFARSRLLGREQPVLEHAREAVSGAELAGRSPKRFSLVAGPETFVYLVSASAGKRLVEVVGEWSGSDAKGPAGASPPVSASLASELQRVADLHASGALTDEEFAAAKARLLADGR